MWQPRASRHTMRDHHGRRPGRQHPRRRRASAAEPGCAGQPASALALGGRPTRARRRPAHAACAWAIFAAAGAARCG
eukprot:343892-Chlamydomonas_euryale.AAC.1